MSGVAARRLASVARLFAELALAHEDNNVPPAPPAIPGAEPDDPEATWDYAWYGLAFNGAGGPEEPEDYRCCECGCWVPEWTELDGLPDPWGYAMKMSTVRTARAWLATYDPEGPWAWHPQQVEMKRDMDLVVERWPGEVCGECWDEWQG
jgi:hypothetical protein